MPGGPGSMFAQNASYMANAPMTASPSSPNDSGDDDPAAVHSGQWQPSGGSGQASPSSTSLPPRTPAPLQKRRRVTRACDECRRKKIKCDGKQPYCTYDQPSNRRRNPAPQYIEALENRLQRAEALLRTFLPNVDLHDPNIDATIQQQLQARGAKPFPTAESASKPTETTEEEQDAPLRSMIASTGQLDLDENGRWDFHGGSSGTVFVRRMREQFGGLLGTENNGPLFPKVPHPSTFLNSPGSSAESPLDSGLPNTMDLPSKATAKVLCSNSLDLACSVLRFVHQPSFYEMVDRIYDTPPENYGNEENRFLPLLYVVLALGCMFVDSEGSENTTYKTGIDQGIKFFRASRQMLEITDCRDIMSLQSIIFMILFLQASANLSTCYSYIGIALRSALRMGLHRNLAGNFNPIDREVRRRVFWVIRKMDTYVSALLGFPQMLSYDDIDQELPVEVDDEYITKDAILPMPEGKTSLYAASNAHTRLMSILAKVCKYIYPTKGVEKSAQGSANSSYVISHAKIREIEHDLVQWLDKLPMALRPGGEPEPGFIRVQQLLRLAYAHVQMMLYRPFLHYVSRKTSGGKNLDERSYACAAACVSVSRNIVHITTEMKKSELLLGAYWFTMYTTFFAILSLVFFAVENPDKPGSQEILADAIDGKDALKGLSRGSQAADRCSQALRALFEQLPQRQKGSHVTPILPKNKRPAASPNLSAQREPSSHEQSLHDPGPSMGLPGRATTFPMAAPSQNANKPTSPFEPNQFQMNTISNPSLRQSYLDLMSPADLSTTGTPDSGSTSNSIQQPLYPLQQPYVGNSVPDLSAMMFPSTDPFAYPPNQPMMELDNVKHENLGNFDNSQNQGMFMPSNTSAPGVYDDLEGQLFGPLPPYLIQGQPNFDFQGQTDLGGGMMSGLNPPNMNYNPGLAQNGDMNFVLSDNDEWNNMLADQKYRL
ncbi:uncharacterized protein BP5553_00429 [Venustampulla echinocandica]|uniref:Zn(2)-C6 fungal-type domain-containing protein n=1 Tax=Venustampulla echinocandica TaxID=2656787 RepID=A0A370TY57_9HELO|nr:uncharacterized protein BP5553_00429 [Venustampulla echinocandica]RDL40450.1 hypothetical protein BP5553_00429 [Venustampulla echinocandica]